MREGLNVLRARFPVIDIVIRAATHRLTGIAPRACCISIARADDRVLVHLRGMGLGRGDESRTHPDAAGSQSERCCEAAAIINAACRDDRNVHGFHGLCHQRHRPHQTGMPAAFAALQDDRIAASLFGLDGMLHRAANDHDFHIRLLQALHDRHRNAETGYETVGTIVDDDVHAFFKAFRAGGQQVHAEGPVGQFAHALHLAFNEVRGRPRHAEHAVSARIAHGRTNFGVGHTAHAREHDGVFGIQHFCECGFYGHDGVSLTL